MRMPCSHGSALLQPFVVLVGRRRLEGAAARHSEKESIPSCAREQRTLAMGDVAGDRSE